MKIKNILKYLFAFILIIYLALFITNKAGYYDYKNYKKATLTQEQIIKFEQDVKDGKNINLEDYLIDEVEIKDNKLAKTGKKLSIQISNTLNGVISKTFSYLGKFVKE